MGILSFLFGRNDDDEEDRRRAQERYATPSLLEATRRDEAVAKAHHEARVKRAKSRRRWFDDEY